MFSRVFVAVGLAGILQFGAASAMAWGPLGSFKSADNAAESGPITCVVMESFDETKLGVAASIFHQRNKTDGPLLGSLLLAHTGQEMELRVTGGQAYRATVFRVKSAFGRGLVLLPTGKVKLHPGDEFTLRFVGEN